MATITPLKPAGRAADPRPGTARPRLAVVLPVFKHSVLVTEAIRSALAQKTDVPFKLVVVNDGCPFPETHETLTAQAEAAPDTLVYLRRANGGLSAARNTGIDYVLAALPSVEAIYFLDADNRLYPHALQRAWEALQANPHCGWAYPDIDMFGVEINARAPAEYSVLKHLAENTCEAGSMVRRRLFERGLRFDESMKLGFEDWDFWLQAVGQGYGGVRVDTMGFRYRKRPESMLSNSERDRAEILAYMRRKHKKLYSRERVLAAEHAEAPRFAFYLADCNEVMLATDPAAEAPRLAWGDFTARFLGAWADPDREHCPNYLVFTTEAALARLVELKLLHWSLWRLEDALEGWARFAALAIDAGGRANALGVREGGPEAPLGLLRRADLVMTTRKILQECVADASTGWLTSLAEPEPQPPVFELAIAAGTAAGQRPLSGGSVAHLLRAFFELRHHVHDRPPLLAAEWRKVETVAQSDLHLTAREILKAKPLYPRLRGGAGERNVGFVLPLVSFGGVEKVAINLARSLGRQGWTPHLFVFAASGVDNLGELREVFASISFLADPLAEQYDPTGRYFGTEFSAWANGGDHARAVGLLAGMDAVINGHSTDAHAVMGALKRVGMVTVNHLHLVDRGPHGEPTGSPYRAIAYEHAFDAILVISQRLYDWCRAMGIPDGKLLLARNAPSFALPADEVAAILEERRSRAEAPLRVAFIGRFDRQKGIERLAALVQACKAHRLAVDWRVVGGAVLIEGETDQLAEAIEPFRHPPARSPAELTEHLAWADVILQPSHFEGVPLMLLEAMRVGVVPLATDVGAVREIVEDGRTGHLVENGPSQAVVAAMLERLAAMAADRGRLLGLAVAGAAAAKRHDWDRTAKTVSDRLETLRLAKSGEPKPTTTDEPHPGTPRPAAMAGAVAAPVAAVGAAAAAVALPAQAAAAATAAAPAPLTNPAVLEALQDKIDAVLRPLFEQPRYALLDWPDYSNTGDHLIWMGAQIYLQRRLGLSPIYCGPINGTPIERLRSLPPEVPLVFTGGGNFGDLWDRHQLYREHVARTFPDRRIVVLPQTVHFREAANLERAAASFGGHPDLHLIARDAVSHAVLRDAFADNNVAMAPDMALFLTDFVGPVGELIGRPPEHDALYLLRGDIEKVDARGNPEFGPHWVDWTAEAAIDGEPIGPLAEEALAAAGAEDLVRSAEDRESWARFVFGCALLGRGRRLVTDRLHGHILAMVMGMENRLLDNVYSKNRTFYESWTYASPICDFSPTLSQRDA